MITQNKNIEYGGWWDDLNEQKVKEWLTKLVNAAKAKKDAVKNENMAKAAEALKAWAAAVPKQEPSVEAKSLSPTKQIETKNPPVETKLIASPEQDQEPIVETQDFVSSEKIETKNPPVEAKFLSPTKKKSYTEKARNIADESWKTKREKQQIVAKDKLMQNFADQNDDKETVNIVENNIVKVLIENGWNIINELMKLDWKKGKIENTIVDNFVSFKKKVQAETDLIVMQKPSWADILNKEGKTVANVTIGKEWYKITNVW